MWSSLSCVRSLGQKGYYTATSDSAPDVLARYSRYSKSFFVYPSVSYQPIEFIDYIYNKIEEEKFDVLLPLFDEIIPISFHKKKLEKKIKMAIMDYETYVKISDKGHFSKYVQSKGLQIPKTYWIEKIDDVKKYKSAFKFPMVVKLRHSAATMGVFFVNDYLQLQNKIQQLTNNSNNKEYPIIQEVINGHQIVSQAVFDNGKLIAVHMYKNLREYPDNSGSGVIRESIFIDEIRKINEALFCPLNWHGTVGLDFLCDFTTKKLYLLEANPRIVLGVNNAIASGVDIPYLLYKVAVGEKTTPVTSYQEGVKTRSLIFDLVWVLNKMKEKNKLESLYSFLFPNIGSKLDDVFLNDIMPTFAVLLKLFKLSFKKSEIRGNFLKNSIFVNDTLKIIEENITES